MDGFEKRFDMKIGGVEKRLDMRIDRLDVKIDGVEKRLDGKIAGVDIKTSNIALLLIKTRENIDHIEETMATKKDVDQIYTKLDSMDRELRSTDQEQRVQFQHIKDVKDTSRNHETRIAALEAS